MDWLKQLITFGIVIAMCLGATYIGSTQGSSNSLREQLRATEGKVAGFSDGLLIVDFNAPLVASCGDTEIKGYATTPDGFVIQLKPVFIPQDKASIFTAQQGNVIVFPVWDVAPFFQEQGAYKLEFYVDNTCGYLPMDTVKLPIVILSIKSDGVSV